MKYLFYIKAHLSRDFVFEFKFKKSIEYIIQFLSSWEIPSKTYNEELLCDFYLMLPFDMEENTKKKEEELFRAILLVKFDLTLK